MMQVGYAALWWVAVTVIGLIAFPLVSRVCRRLPDRGYGISKLLGLLLLTYFSWILSSAHLIKFGYVNISVSIVLLLALSLLAGRRHLNLRSMPWRRALLSEALFTAAFVAFLVFLWYKPDIYFGYSEDFMNFAFLQSVLRSDYFPPPDPWLAGQSIPYYYGGHLLTAILTLISRVPSGIAYNVAVAMFFALAVGASFSLGLNATRRKLYGFVTVLFVCLAGFISGVFQLSAHFAGHEVAGYAARDAEGFLDWLLTYDLAAQVIPYTGNSYPYYTFLQGELHAHTTSIPFQLMYLTLLLTLLKGRRQPRGGRTDSLLIIAILGVSLGFISFVNSWDYPAYLALTVLAFVLLKIDLSKKGFLSVLALSVVLYLPYYLSRGTGGLHGIGLVQDRTLLVHLLEMLALFLFVTVSFLFVISKGSYLKGKALAVSAMVLLAAGLAGFLFHYQLLLILVPLILASLYLICRAREKEEKEFMLVLILTGCLIALFCEFFFIDDSLYVPFQRYNTVLKFYLQVWVMVGVASAYAVFWVLRNSAGKRKVAWLGLLTVLVLAALLQPVGLTAGWTSGRQSAFGVNRGTLDGLAYVATLAPGDYEAIRWIDEHIEGSPVILESPGATYRFTSRVATMTGLPTVGGWLTHEVMWRGGWDRIAGRDTDVDTIYETLDGGKAASLLTKYNVRYIFIGQVEREKYEASGLLKFADQPDRYELVYGKQDVEIYKVLP